MSSEDGNWCAPQHPEEVKETQRIEDPKFDDNFQLPMLKLENEQSNQIFQNNYNYGDYPIKKEPEDSQDDVQMLAENDVALKEEVDIEEHKPGRELIAGTGTRNAAKFNCTHCPFKTNIRSYFVMHCKYRHAKDVEMYKCQKCSYETKRKGDLTQHSKDAEVCKYQECSYDTKYKYNLTQHYKNKPSKDAKLYKCQECAYEANRKTYLTVHYKRMHGKDSDLYKCAECSYEARRKELLTQHYKRKHGKDSEVYKCSECSYEARRKDYLTEHHKRKHGKGFEVYKCQVCSFQTIYKHSLTGHYENKHSREAELCR